MSLKKQLMDDLKTALKEKDQVRKSTITMLRAAILQEEKDHQTELDDEQIIEIASKQLKQRRDVLPSFTEAGRQDLIDQTNREIEVIMDYLPQQLSEAEIETLVTQTISELGIQSKKDMGKLMKTIMPKVKGKADGKTVSKIVNKILK